MLRCAAVAATTDISQRSFLCPCCRKILYSLRPGENGAAAWEPTSESPRVNHDNTGPFLKCPSCSRRIAVVVSAEYADEPFFVAANQNCRHLAPD
jgi:DNA-directed RNA polymerase subunit RPC12/RpoP